VLLFGHNDTTPLQRDIFMTEIQIKCYQCQTPLETYPPYFCDDECKKLYWGGSPIAQKEKQSRPIGEIQQLLAKKADEARAQQAIVNRQKFHDELNRTYKTPDDPADFMADLVAT